MFYKHLINVFMTCISLIMSKHWFAYTFLCTMYFCLYITTLSLLQRRNGVLMSPYTVTSSVGERRLVAWFQVGGAQRGEQDLYRCITQSTYGAAVSNFAELIVRGMSNHSFKYILVSLVFRCVFINSLFICVTYVFTSGILLFQCHTII